MSAPVLFSDAPPPPARTAPVLRESDLDVLDLVADGLTNDEIARRLYGGAGAVRYALVAAFPSGTSVGTMDCVRRATRVGIPVRVYEQGIAR